MTPSIADRMHALVDAAKVRAGVLNPASPFVHPDTARILADKQKILDSMAALAAIKHAPGSTSHGSAIAKGLNSDDFKNALGDFGRSIAVRRFQAGLAHRQICRLETRPDFKPFLASTLGVDFQLDEQGESCENTVSFGLLSPSGIEAKIRTYATNIAITRQVVISDDIGVVARLFANAAAAAARREAMLVYGLLASNPTLSDGMPLIDPAFENAVSGSLDSENFSAAVGKLRAMHTTSGDPADLPTARLVVSGDLEIVARTLVESSGLSDSCVVVATAMLPAGRWYVMAHPDIAPVITLYHLQNSDAGGVLVSPTKGGLTDGRIVFGLRLDVGLAAVDRLGVVGGGV